MRVLVAFLLCVVFVALSCTDRDDKLEGVQIRVQNMTTTALSEVAIDSLTFQDVDAGQTVFYQRYEGATLPAGVLLIGDSLSMNITVDSILQIDSTVLNLFTYKIKGLVEGESTTVAIVRD